MQEKRVAGAQAVRDFLHFSEHGGDEARCTFRCQFRTARLKRTLRQHRYAQPD